MDDELLLETVIYFKTKNIILNLYYVLELFVRPKHNIIYNFQRGRPVCSYCIFAHEHNNRTNIQQIFI